MKIAFINFAKHKIVDANVLMAQFYISFNDVIPNYGKHKVPIK